MCALHRSRTSLYCAEFSVPIFTCALLVAELSMHCFRFSITILRISVYWMIWFVQKCFATVTFLLFSRQIQCVICVESWFIFVPFSSPLQSNWTVNPNDHNFPSPNRKSTSCYANLEDNNRIVKTVDMCAFSCIFCAHSTYTSYYLPSRSLFILLIFSSSSSDVLYVLFNKCLRVWSSARDALPNRAVLLLLMLV